MRAVPVSSFPSVRLRCGTEVNLVGQLGHGGGTVFIRAAQSLQKQHASFKDALEEPSALLGRPDPLRGDPTSLYSFLVEQRHPMHRHQGRRVFVAVSGSQGAELRFCVAADDALASPRLFAEQVERVRVPPDSLFSVRFGGGVWHSFAGLAGHPAFFALSVHPDETGGVLSEEQMWLVRAGIPSIASLTEVLPFDLSEELVLACAAPIVSLSLERDASAARQAVCSGVRGSMGRLRSAAGARRSGGWLLRSPHRVFETSPAALELALLEEAMPGPVQHQDGFVSVFETDGRQNASAVLEAVLGGFVHNAPRSVGLLMRLRNAAVTPLRLRTAPIACPVSSLLGAKSAHRFGEFPVWAWRAEEDQAEVMLGADDRHVAFRTVVGVKMIGANRARLAMGTRLATRNWFGTLYSAAVDLPHRKFITPLIMQAAIDHALDHKT